MTENPVRNHHERMGMIMDLMNIDELILPMETKFFIRLLVEKEEKRRKKEKKTNANN